MVRILLHLAHHELLIERAAVDANAHRLAVIARDFADRRKLLVATLTMAYIAGVDAVFIQHARAFRILRKQDMAVVMEVADDRDVAAGIVKALLDFGYGGRGFGDIDGDANKLRAGLRQFETLLCRARGIGRIGIRHGLDDDRRTATHLHLADLHAIGLMSLGDHAETILADILCPSPAAKQKAAP